MLFNDQSFNDKLTNDIINFEQLGQDFLLDNVYSQGFTCTVRDVCKLNKIFVQDTCLKVHFLRLKHK